MPSTTRGPSTHKGWFACGNVLRLSNFSLFVLSSSFKGITFNGWAWCTLHTSPHERYKWWPAVGATVHMIQSPHLLIGSSVIEGYSSHCAAQDTFISYSSMSRQSTWMKAARTLESRSHRDPAGSNHIIQSIYTYLANTMQREAPTASSIG